MICGIKVFGYIEPAVGEPKVTASGAGIAFDASHNLYTLNNWGEIFKSTAAVTTYSPTMSTFLDANAKDIAFGNELWKIDKTDSLPYTIENNGADAVYT